MYLLEMNRRQLKPDGLHC